MILVSLTLVGAIWLFYANHQDKDSQTKVNTIIASTIYLSASMSMIFKKIDVPRIPAIETKNHEGTKQKE